MTHPIALVIDRSNITRWQAARIIASVQVFAFVVEPSAVVGALYYEDDPSNDQIGLTLVVQEQAGAKLIKYFEQLTASACS